MAYDMSVVSLAKSLSNQSHSTTFEQDKTLTYKMEAAATVIRVIQTQITYLEAAIKKGKSISKAYFQLFFFCFLLNFTIIKLKKKN